MPKPKKEQITFHPVAKLCDGIYQREKLLVDEGIRSFTPLLRFDENFAEDEDELQEYREKI